MKMQSPRLSAALALLASSTFVAAVAAPMSDAAFVTEASRSNQVEIAAAQAILKTTTDGRVRAYATMMIADHSTANVELRAAARRAGLTVPAFRTVTLGGVGGPETPPPARTTSVGAPVDSGDLAHSGSMSASSAGKPDAATGGVLAQASSAPQNGPQSFTRGDLAYLREQVADHEKSLAAMQAEAKSGQNAELKSYADEQATIVSKHLQLASADLDNGSIAPSPAASAVAVPTAGATAPSNAAQPGSQASSAP